MSITDTSPFQTFLATTRRRIWLQKTLTLLLCGTWWSSAVALIIGLVNIFFYPLSGMLFIALIIMPIGLALIWGAIFYKPSLQTTATTADSWFSGKSLMSSALDQLTKIKEKHTCTGQFLIEQAVLTAPKWRKQLRHNHRLKIPKKMIVPLSLFIAGGFLIQLPQQTKHSYETAATPPISHVSTVIQKLPANNLIAELQQELRTHTARENGRQEDQHAKQGTAAEPDVRTTLPKGAHKQDSEIKNKTSFVAMPNLGDNQQISVKSDNQVQAEARQQNNPTRTRGEKNSTPGMQSASRINMASAQQTEQLDIEFFNVPAHRAIKNKKNTGKGEKIELNKINMKMGSHQTQTPVATAEFGVSMPYELTLTPSQKRYIALYFKRLGETP